MPITTFSTLERATLAGAARGETVAETAGELGIPVGTVKQLRRAVLDKLGDASNMAAAVHRAHELGILGQAPDPSALPLTDGQRRAFHAKCGELDVAHDLDRRTTKRQILVEASQRFRRNIESANDLSRSEANELLELLEQRLDGVDADTAKQETAAATAGAAA